MAIINGTPNDDYLNGTSADDTMNGGDGNDEMNGLQGNDVIHGDNGADKLFGREGNDDLQGGDGNDILYGDYFIGTSLPDADGADILDGGAGNDTINGGGFNDTIFGGADSDQLWGGAGQDHIDGGDGNDFISGLDEVGYAIESDLDTLIGGNGDDSIQMTYGDSVDGGAGADTLGLNFYASGTAGVIVDLRQLADNGTVTIGGAAITNIEYVGHISLTQYDDKVIAGIPVPGSSGMEISGWGGDDELTGTASVDNIWGGDGNDILWGNGGTNPAISPSGDRLRGEAGDDVIHIGTHGAEATGGIGNDLIYGGDGIDSIHGDGGNDILFGGGGADGLIGWDGDDVVTGGDGVDYLRGMDGIDTLDYSQESGGQDVFVNFRFSGMPGPGPGGVIGSGKARDTYGNIETVLEFENVVTGAGNDSVYGTAIANRIETGAGNDVLLGGGGADVMIGGTGNDTYWFQIEDFVGAPTGTIVELPGGGIDEVATTLAGFSIADIAEVENLTGYNASGSTLTGNGLANVITGAAGADLIDGGAGNDRILAGAGVDTLVGGDGNDVLYFGAAFTAEDRADGGADRDALVLQGNYAVTLSGMSVTGIESLSLQSGANATFGDTANNFYDFDIATADDLVATGQQLIVNAQSLRAGEDFTFDGSAETDGRFLVYGGHGVDDLTGGDGVDVFFFEGSRWGDSDKVDGGGGRDSLVISAGSGLTHIEFAADSFTNIESISVNNLYATDPSQKPSYELVLHNGNVAPGETLIVNGSSIPSGQVVNIDGRGVHDGNLILFGGGGHDVLTGGDGADTLYGGSGADALAGGAGADIFRYDATTDSTTGAPDLIGDFQPYGIDKIDLSRIDANTLAAGDQAFTWISVNAFSGTGAASAGQLRIRDDGAYRWIEGDTNGDGSADFAIAFYHSSAPQIQSDFLL